MAERSFLALSVANLLFLRSWAELLRMKAISQAATPAGRALLAATLINITGLAMIMVVLRSFVGRFGPRWVAVAHCIFLGLLLSPIDYLDSHVRPFAFERIPQAAYLTAWTLLLLVPVLGIVQRTVYGKESIYRLLLRILLVLSPGPFIAGGTIGWTVLGAGAPAPSIAGPLPSTRPERVVWIVFDELDYDFAFPLRPASVAMPEFDRLRRESFFALQAHSPSLETRRSMSGYLLGRAVAEFEGAPPAFEARLQSGETVRLKEQPTLVSEARRLGVDTYIAGWWLPYCEMLGQDLSGCASASVSAIRPSGLAESMRREWELLVLENWLAKRFTPSGRLRAPWAGWELRIDQYLAHQYLLEHSLRWVTHPGGRMVLLHFPIPHPVGIYDRHTDRLSLSTPANSVDNLELVDRTLGDLRRAMEAAGVWDRTTVIVTSDHPMRSERWSKFENWTEEERQLAQKQQGLIPCLIKRAGYSAPIEWSKPFSTIALPSLVLQILRGEARGVANLGEFLGVPRDGLGVE